MSTKINPITILEICIQELILNRCAFQLRPLATVANLSYIVTVYLIHILCAGSSWYVYKVIIIHYMSNRCNLSCKMLWHEDEVHEAHGATV